MLEVAEAVDSIIGRDVATAPDRVEVENKSLLLVTIIALFL